jgi:hypothetical protein
VVVVVRGEDWPWWLTNEREVMLRPSESPVVFQQQLGRGGAGGGGQGGPDGLYRGQHPTPGLTTVTAITAQRTQ